MRAGLGKRESGLATSVETVHPERTRESAVNETRLEFNSSRCPKALSSFMVI